MGFSRQEYWSGLPCPPPGDLPSPGIEFRNPTLPLPENLLDSTIWATRETPWARASYITFLGFCFDMCEVGLMMRSPSERQAVRDGLSPHWLQDDGPTGGRPSLCDQEPTVGGRWGRCPAAGTVGRQECPLFYQLTPEGKGPESEGVCRPWGAAQTCLALWDSPGPGVLGLRGGKVRSSRTQVPHPAPAPRLCLRE